MTGTLADERPGRHVRWFVAVLLTLLVVPGAIGFDAWPLTAWRLFSLARDASETRWEIEAVDDQRNETVLQLDEMQLAYRHAQWLLAELPDAGPRRREEVCRALLIGARKDVPEATTLRVIRDRQRLERVDDGDWVVRHDREVLHRCAGRER